MTALTQAAANLVRAAASLALTHSRLNVPGWVMRGVTVIKSLGPYAAIEILLPGGTLIAIALWLYRSYRKRKVAGVPMTLVPVAS